MIEKHKHRNNIRCKCEHYGYFLSWNVHWIQFVMQLVVDKHGLCDLRWTHYVGAHILQINRICYRLNKCSLRYSPTVFPMITKFINFCDSPVEAQSKGHNSMYTCPTLIPHLCPLARCAVAEGNGKRAERLYFSTIVLGITSIVLTLTVVAEVVIWAWPTSDLQADPCVVADAAAKVRESSHVCVWACVSVSNVCELCACCACMISVHICLIILCK